MHESVEWNKTVDESEKLPDEWEKDMLICKKIFNGTG
jgi:hypothetical protein